MSSAIVAGEDGSAPAYVSSGGGSYEFGVDPNLDPELALALRISLEEERARQESASGAKPDGSAAAAGSSDGTTTAAAGATSTSAAGSAGAMSIEDDLLAQALASSQGDGDHDMEGLTEEQEMQRAIQLSMAGNDSSAANTGAAGSNSNKGGDFDEAMQDPDFMNSVLGSLAGVDTSDPRIQNVLQGFSSASNNTGDEADADKKTKKEGDEKKKDGESK